jgi:hypothetical protein
MIEHGGVDMGKKPKLFDGADREGEGGADSIVVPMIGAKSLDAAPLIHSRKGTTNDIFRDGPDAVGAIVGIAEQDQDFWKIEGDGGSDATMSCNDDEIAVFLPHDRGLKDAEGADIGDELVVGVIAGHGLAGICRIRLEDLGVERA